MLLAEDDDDLRETMRFWLWSDGLWEVVEAADGAEALARLDADVDVLVLERRMPELSGPEIVDRLDETDFDGPVIVVSTYRPDTRLGEDDVTTYLTKPVDRETFLSHFQRSVG